MSDLEGNAINSAKAIWVKYRYHHPLWAMFHAALVLATGGVWITYFGWVWWGFYTGLDELPETGEVKCPSCGHEVDESMEFCPSCGTSVEGLLKAGETECPSCAGKIDESMDFCPSCGTQLNDADE